MQLGLVINYFMHLLAIEKSIWNLLRVATLPKKFWNWRYNKHSLSSSS